MARKLIASLILWATWLVSAHAADKDESTVLLLSPANGQIERLDGTLDKIIPADARIEILSQGHKWCEGPVWAPEGQYVLYSDIPQNAIFRWKEGEGDKLWLKPAGYTGGSARGGESGSNGLCLDPKGHLILCQHGDRRVARLIGSLDHPEPKFLTVADRYQGKRFNSPNDLVFDKEGNLYFTDPPYGLEGNVKDPARELDFQGVYRVSSKGKLTLLTKELTRPNGIALSPDEKTLYVANSDPQKAVWMAYDLKEDGTIDKGRVFYDVTQWVGKRPGLPDGMEVDAVGNLFATGPGGVLIFSPQGKLLGRIDTTQPTANCTFGGADGSTLYITANTYLVRVKTSTKGLLRYQ